MYPVMSHRTVMGQAKTQKQAERLIRSLVDVHPRMRLHVWLRDKDMAGILGLPVAWVYSISYTA